MKQHENIKYQILNIKKIIQRSKIFKLSIFTVLFFFLIFNLISSQVISPLYFQLVSNNKKSVISFLEKIKTFPEFQNIFEMNKNIYGKTVEEETFRQENNKKLMINNLEQQLIINPKARDILYSLYQLYLAEEDTVKAEEYLKRTREVDPVINPTNTTNPDQSDK